MAIPGKPSGKRSSKRARVQCAHLQESRSFSAVTVTHDPPFAITDIEARSSLTSQLSRSTAIVGDIDIGKSILAKATFRVIAQIATNCRPAPNPGFGNYLLVPRQHREHHFANMARGRIMLHQSGGIIEPNWLWRGLPGIVALRAYRLRCDLDGASGRVCRHLGLDPRSRSCRDLVASGTVSNGHFVCCKAGDAHRRRAAWISDLARDPADTRRGGRRRPRDQRGDRPGSRLVPGADARNHKGVVAGRGRFRRHLRRLGSRRRCLCRHAQ